MTKNLTLEEMEQKKLENQKKDEELLMSYVIF
ncbi:hypothetical protein SAMN05421765_1688 [Kaistella antarctica]|nr:hypothetical protein SAMN05421765_1688 [Kaistella antarctica]